MTVTLYISGQFLEVEVKDTQDLLALRQELQKATQYVERIIEEDSL